jgi:hypothetical protein
MPEETPVTPEAPVEPSNALDPYKLLEEAKGPSKATIDVWKQSACNGRVRIFSPDPSFKRLFILRGLSAREWDVAQNEIPQNTPAEKVEQVLQGSIVVRACHWASATQGKLTEDNLRNAGAGLTLALYEIVCQLSDFVPPAVIDRLSADL